MAPDPRVLYPQEARQPRPGIITSRRLPHPTVIPRRPRPRHYVVPEPAQPDANHWNKMVQNAHHRWDRGTGAKIRGAEEAARRAEPIAFDDELDAFVKIQVDRQRRLQSIRSAPPPVVQRLLGPKPVVPPVLSPMDEFLIFVNKGISDDNSPRSSNAETVSATWHTSAPRDPPAPLLQPPLLRCLLIGVRSNPAHPRRRTHRTSQSAT